MNYDNTQNPAMHIGKRIKEVLKQDGRTARWLADNIPCERTNVYNIFHRKSIDTRLLQRICEVMQYDFFIDLSRDTFQNPHKEQ